MTMDTKCQLFMHQEKIISKKIDKLENPVLE